MRPGWRGSLTGLAWLGAAAAGYTIFTAGSSGSLLRLLVADPAYDVSIALALSAAAGLLGLCVRWQSRSDALGRILALNEGYVRDLRAGGASDDEIADSLLHELGSSRGLLHWVARRRLLGLLRRMS